MILSEYTDNWFDEIETTDTTNEMINETVDNMTNIVVDDMTNKAVDDMTNVAVDNTTNEAVDDTTNEAVDNTLLSFVEQVYDYILLFDTDSFDEEPNNVFLTLTLDSDHNQGDSEYSIYKFDYIKQIRSAEVYGPALRE
ncbi:6957_t:CDS:2, partial [Racocetra fulgida]